MYNLKIYENEEFGTVRTVMVDGKPYFVASDVAKALGYIKPQNAIAAHCRGALKQGIGVQTGTKADGTPVMQNIEMLVIPEGDIYRLIIKSKLPSAERFESWVFDKVLPSIRKTGSYNLPGTYKEALQQLLIQVEENERLALENAEMKPKAEYFDDLVDGKLLTNFRDMAKELGIKQKEFIQFLMENKYIYRDQKNQLRPYADKNKGLFELKEYRGRHSDHAGQQTLITPRGREIFRMLLK